MYLNRRLSSRFPAVLLYLCLSVCKAVTRGGYVETRWNEVIKYHALFEFSNIVQYRNKTTFAATRCVRWALNQRIPSGIEIRFCCNDWMNSVHSCWARRQQMKQCVTQLCCPLLKPEVDILSSNSEFWLFQGRYA